MIHPAGKNDYFKQMLDLIHVHGFMNFKYNNYIA